MGCEARIPSEDVTPVGKWLSLIDSLQKWGTESMTPEEIQELRVKFGDRADEVLQYYTF